MEMKTLFKFLKDLENNNNRKWFGEHKEEFDTLRHQWIDTVQRLITGMANFDPSLHNLEAKDCIFRIYRDVRFSPNKAPYKTYIGAVIGTGGRKCEKSCYYIHLQPNNQSGLYGGVWCPESRILTSLRHAIDDNIDEFKEIVESPDFSSTYNLIGDSLKTAPKGFDRNSPNIKYLRLKEYVLEHKVDDNFFSSDDWIEQTAKLFSLQVPFHKFLNFTLEEEL